MDNFTLLLLTTYLYAIFIIVLRIKVSNKAIRPFKFILLILIAFTIYYLIDYNGNVSVLARIIAFIPLLYILVMTYINQFNRVFKKLGLNTHSSQPKTQIDNEFVEELISSVEFLSRKKIGALITIERNVSLTPFIKKALWINADFSKELLTSIFIPTTPLHDGAVIIRGNKILCAKTYYPSTERTDLPRKYGTRHRAGIGISEQSDALTIIVSEETGNVSITVNRQMEYDISKETLSLYFEKFLQIK